MAACQLREDVVDGVGRQNLSALDILLHAGSIVGAVVHVNLRSEKGALLTISPEYRLYHQPEKRMETAGLD